MAEIFISYKSERRKAAEHLAEVLTHYGYSVWFDYRLIKGSDFRTQIEARIHEAKALVVLWCTLSVRSSWVTEEAGLASKRGILIPVKIEPCDLPFGFAFADTIDMTDWDAAPRGPQLDPLIEALEQRIGRPPHLDFRGARQYEAHWRRFGAQTLKEFALGPPLAGVEAARAAPAVPVIAAVPGPQAAAAREGFEAAARPRDAETERRRETKAEPIARGPSGEPAGGAQTGTPLPLGEAERSRQAKEEHKFAAASADHASASAGWLSSHRALTAGALVGGGLLAAALAWFANSGQQTVPPPQSDARPAPAPTAPATPVAISDRPAPIVFTPLPPERERALKPKDTFRECDNCPEMVVVPAGSFTMGSPDGEEGRYADEGPQHVVQVGQPFAVGKFHVTVDQFAAFVAETHYDAGSTCRTFEGGKVEERSGRSWRNPGFPQEGSHPAVCLNWKDAKAYVDWLAAQSGRPYRLLTEAEWEYAARGRTAPGRYPRFWFGNDDKDLCTYGNGADQAARDNIEGAKGWTIAPCNDGYAYTSPAGHFPANGFGLQDMFGNAWQWTADCWHDSYKDAPSDGTAWTTGDCGRRVVRGGSWDYDPRNLRAADRSRDSDRSSNVGFRVGRTLTP